MQQSAETLLSVLLFTSFIVYLLQKMLKFLRAFLTSSSILFDRKMRSVTNLTILYQYRRSMKLCTGSTASEAKRKSLVDENGEVAKDKVMNMLYDELRTWTARVALSASALS